MRKVVILLAGLLVACHRAEVDDATTPDTQPIAGTGPVTGPVEMEMHVEHGQLPCAVDTILRDKCQQCHGHPTAQTAPMSLTTWDELHAPALEQKDAPAKVFERMALRLHDALRPMPPRDQPQLTAQERIALDDWLAGGASSGEPCVTPPPVPARVQPVPPSVPDADADADAGARGAQSDLPATALPSGAGSATPDGATPPDPSECEYVEVRAQSDANGTPFEVPADATDLYQCFLIDRRFGAPTQGLGFENLTDNASVVHHWMLRTIDQIDNDKTLITCDDLYPNNKLVASWAPGAPNWYLPKDVGIDLGRGLFILEIHYNNIGKPATNDRSGVRVCTTKQLKPNTASVSWLGSTFFSIPPKAKDYAVPSRCKPTHQTQPIHILQVWPHMHVRGARSSMRIDRADGTKQTLFDEPFSFDSQKAYPTPTIVGQGDSVYSTCYFDNPDNYSVGFGTKTTDEMCHFFVVSYPAYQLVNDALSLENDVCYNAP